MKECTHEYDVMRSRRALSINNSLVHGICNYSCRLCSINKPGYSGPREFQSFHITRALVDRIEEAAESGIRIRYVTNSGDGEPTLHPEFRSRMDMFGRMLREWSIEAEAAPEVSLVTNGSTLHRKYITDAIIDNPITVIVSLPSVDPLSYGKIMTGCSESGAELLPPVLDNVRRMMEFRARGVIPRLSIHISPPERELIRRDFDRTVQWLADAAGRSGLDEIELVMFPAVSNRAGGVLSSVRSIDTYRDIFRRYRHRRVNGISIKLMLVLKRFFRSTAELMDLIRSFRFPCLWNANFFITPDGRSICCNDQSALDPMGNILSSSIEELMELKEELQPRSICRNCNQSPDRLSGSPAALFYSLACRLRMRFPGHAPRGREEGASSARSGRDAVIQDFRVSMPSSEDEMKDIFGLVYRRYLDYGYQAPDPSEMRFRIHNLIPFSYPLVVSSRNGVEGTITVVREGPLGLPMQRYFGPELSSCSSGSGEMCELTSLAVGGNRGILESRELLFHMFRYAFILSRDLLGCTDFCMMTNPRHAQFYRKQFRFEIIGEVLECDCVGNAPAVPMYLNLESAEMEIKRSDPDLHRFFSVFDRKITRMEIAKSLNNHNRVYCTDYVDSMLQSSSGFTESLKDEEWRVLVNHYPDLKRKYL
jgi:hypothetical protein